MTQDEALKLALEALEAHADIGIKSDKAIAAIKEALANVAINDTSKERVDEMQKQRHEQEPVVGTKTWFEDGKVVTQYLYPSDIYTTPPQREWVGLTAKETSDFVDQYWANDAVSMKELIGFVEAKLKEKNT